MPLHICLCECSKAGLCNMNQRRAEVISGLVVGKVHDLGHVCLVQRSVWPPPWARMSSPLSSLQPTRSLQPARQPH